MSVVFPKEFFGFEAEVPTLALVVPDVRAASQSLVLIGTNTLDVLYETYLDVTLDMQPPTSNGYKAVLKILELRLPIDGGWSQCVTRTLNSSQQAKRWY